MNEKMWQTDRQTDKVAKITRFRWCNVLKGCVRLSLTQFNPSFTYLYDVSVLSQRKICDLETDRQTIAEMKRFRIQRCVEESDDHFDVRFMSIDQPFTKICTKNDFYVFVPVTLTFDLSFSYSCPLSYAIASRHQIWSFYCVQISSKS